jgi:hypothetical protein
MDEKHPDQGIEGQGRDLDPERGLAIAAPDGETPRPAAELPPTGDDRVDEAVAGLSRLPGAPAEEHVAVLEEVHGRLRDILGELNEGAP